MAHSLCGNPYQPFTDEGFEVPEVQERIKQTIQYLFYRVLYKKAFQRPRSLGCLRP